MIKKVLVFIIFTFIISCQTKFNKDKWLINVEGEYTHRDQMLKNLIDNAQLKEKTYGQILNLLGMPDDYCNYNTYELGYRIKEVKDKTAIGFNDTKIKSLVLILDKPKEEVDLHSKVIDVKVIFW